MTKQITVSITAFLLLFVLTNCAKVTTGEVQTNDSDIPYSKMAINMFPRNKTGGDVVQQMRDIKSLKLLSVRVNFWFDTFYMRRANSQPDFTKFDEMVDAAQITGTDLLGILGAIPDWLRGDPDWKSTFISKYVVPVVTRYKGKVKSWEIWNEPDNQDMLFGVLDGTPEDYFELLKVVTPVIHAIDPGARIVAASAMSIVLDGLGKLNWTKRLIDLGVKQYADVLNIHYYSELDPELGTVVKFVVQETGMTVWVTETGETGLDNQLKYFTDIMPYIDASLSPERIYLYCYIEGAGENQKEPQDTTFGLVTYAGGARLESSLYTHLKNR